MKISIINTPMRGLPDHFPPYGSLCLVQYLKKRGITNVEFINADYFRYSVDEVLEKLINNGTEILGISAVTSTAYTYSKEISLKFKEKKPNSLIVLGGNLAASAEIVLKKTGVDFCALGEGEIIFYNLVKKAQETKNFSDFKDISGLAYIDESGEVVNTGYEEKLNSAEMYDADWSDLFKDNTADHYIQDVFDKDGNLLISHFQHDKRTFERHRKGKKFFTFIIGKGCVARCTFCHRWDKGIRYVPIEVVMERLDFLIEKHNVGFISPFVESFGNDKKWLDKFYEEIKKRDILWYSGAVRARTVSPEIIEQMKDSGCTSLYYGLETGSEKMLSIMEKKTSLQDNRNAQQWTVNAGFYSTIIQFIVGMPGESPETINESLEFSKWAYTLNENLNPLIFSINYAQALPGTPLYEYGRKMGLIGRDIGSEEEYLIFVSDRDAADVGSVVNFTDYPMAVLLSWKHILYFGTIVAYVKKYGIKQLIKVNSKSGDLKTRKLTKYNDFIFNFKTYRRVLVYTILYKFKSILPFIVLYKYRKRIGNKRTLKFLWELLKYVLSFGVKKDTKIELNKSLRKIVDNEMDIIDTDIPQMAPLRKGR